MSSNNKKNIDREVVNSFGNEWEFYDQSSLSESELNLIFKEYFEIFPWKNLSDQAVGFDLGCGSGRWAKCVAPKVHHLHCLDPSTSIEVAKNNLKDHHNCSFYQKSVDDIPFDDCSMDFGYSLGVLHHIPDTQDGLNKCIKKLKKGAPFLVYLYYAFDNQPFWYKIIWKISDFFRKIISRSPFFIKIFITNLIAALVYFPLSIFSKLFYFFGYNVKSFPLNNYKDKSFYTMRTDALDRFGTKLELRYTKREIEKLMINSGLHNIKFSNSEPFWVAVGIKK